MLYRKRPAVEAAANRLSWKWLLKRAYQLRSYFIPRPVSGSFWLDHVYLLCAVVLQFTILPSLFGIGRWFAIDLLTPWIVIINVIQKRSIAFYFTFLTSLILETHSTIPFGFFLAVYGMFFVAIQHLRETLSWKHITPWAVTFVLTSTVVSLFEMQVLLLKENFHLYDYSFIVGQIERVFSSLFFGLLLTRRSLLFMSRLPDTTATAISGTE